MWKIQLLKNERRAFSLLWTSYETPKGLVGKTKHPSASEGDERDMCSTPVLGRSPGGGNGNPLQYSCLENPVDRGA